MNEDEGKKFEQLQQFINAAEAMHDMFLSFTAAGFTETQALYLVAQMLKGNAQ